LRNQLLSKVRRLGDRCELSPNFGDGRDHGAPTVCPATPMSVPCGPPDAQPSHRMHSMPEHSSSAPTRALRTSPAKIATSCILLRLGRMTTLRPVVRIPLNRKAGSLVILGLKRPEHERWSQRDQREETQLGLECGTASHRSLLRDGEKGNRPDEVRLESLHRPARFAWIVPKPVWIRSAVGAGVSDKSRILRILTRRSYRSPRMAG